MYAANDIMRGKATDRTKKWKKEHPELYQAQLQRFNRKHAEYQRNRSLVKNYGITVDQYNELLFKQNGVCAICKGIDKHRLAVDHDHTTGEVRGLLCIRCNLGMERMDIDGWSAAAESYRRTASERISQIIKDPS